MVAAVVWLAIFQPLDRPGLVWGGSVYKSKEEFNLYLRSKGLSYGGWLKRNPGVAPWEPGERAEKSDGQSRVWDWKRDALLGVNAILLAAIAAILLGRASTRIRDDQAPGSRAHVVARKAAQGLDCVVLGASELTQAIAGQVRATSRDELVLLSVMVGLAAVTGLLVALFLAG